MEFQKIINLLDTTSDDKELARFSTKKWIEVYDQSEQNYSVNKEIRHQYLDQIYVILVMHILV